MSDEDGGVLLEDRGDRQHGDLLADKIERHERVGADVEVEDAGREKLRMIDLRPARPQLHIKAMALVDAGGDGLVEAAMLGLRLPIGAEIDALGGCREWQ